MAPIAIPAKRRKNIDIEPDVFKTLSIAAMEAGKSLKAYIEDLLRIKAKEYSEEIGTFDITEQLCIALNEVKDVRDGKLKAYSWEEYEKKLEND